VSFKRQRKHPKQQQGEFWRYVNDRAFKKRFSHGGGKSVGKRKVARPVSTKDPIHIVLKSSRAVGAHSMQRAQHRAAVSAILYKQAKKFFVQIRGYENVGNHLHLEVRATARKEFQQFLKSITCLIARKVTGARRGVKFGKFWDYLAFTRVLKTYTELEILRRYFFANRLEAEIGPEARATFLSCWYG